MKMSGEYRISAPRQFVWDALNDPAILKNCLPGCEKFENTSDSVFDAIITTKVGLVKMTFASSIELSEIDLQLLIQFPARAREVRLVSPRARPRFG